MHISRLHKWDNEYLVAFSEEDATRLGLVEGSVIDFSLSKVEDPASILTKQERDKINREYESFKQYLEDSSH